MSRCSPNLTLNSILVKVTHVFPFFCSKQIHPFVASSTYWQMPLQMDNQPTVALFLWLLMYRAAILFENVYHIKNQLRQQIRGTFRKGWACSQAY